MNELEILCDSLIHKTCHCLAGRQVLLLIAAASYAGQVLHTSACCAVTAVYDLVQNHNTAPTPTLVLKILCTTYVNQKMRNLITQQRSRRDRSRSPRRCERFCERLCEGAPQSSSDSPGADYDNPADSDGAEESPSPVLAVERSPLPLLPPGVRLAPHPALSPANDILALPPNIDYIPLGMKPSDEEGSDTSDGESVDIDIQNKE